MDLVFVDTHVHFWEPGRLAYHWLAEFPAINRLHGLEDLRAEAGARHPAQMVFVECDGDAARFMDEVAWIESLAAREPRIAGIVAFTPVDRGAETTRALDALRARPLVRGVRHLIQGHDDPGFCLRPEFVAGVRALGERELSFDVCIKHHQLPPVVELVRACPGTAFVLDHGGKPDIKARRLDPWRADVARLAALPNVTCKLSGLVTEADLDRWTLDDLRPYADHLLATFGPGRVMFGGDWPMAKIASGYTRWLDAALALLEPLGAAERRAVLADNARRVYRLP
jgi:L-fuconolactonase